MVLKVDTTERPCQRCRTRGQDCLYDIQDQMISVPESYLKGLNRTLKTLGDLINQQDHAQVQTDSTPDVQDVTTVHTVPSIDTGITEPLVEDTTAETFIHKLKNLPSGSKQLNKSVDAFSKLPFAVSPQWASGQQETLSQSQPLSGPVGDGALGHICKSSAPSDHSPFSTTKSQKSQLHNAWSNFPRTKLRYR